MKLFARPISLAVAILAMIFPVAIGAPAPAPVAFRSAPYVERYNAKVSMQFAAASNAVAKYCPVLAWELKKGKHRLVVSGREAGARLESIFIGKKGAEPGKAAGLLLAASDTRPTAPMTLDATGSALVLIGGKNGGEAVFEFTLDEDQTVVFWGKVFGPDEKSNSFFISVDGQAPYAWSFPVTKDGKTRWLEMEDRSLDPYLPWAFWLSWGATSPQSLHRDEPELRRLAMKLTEVAFDQLREKARKGPAPSLWFLRELELANLWAQDPRTPRSVVNGLLERIRPCIDSCHTRATNGDGWGDNTPNILLQQAVILRLASMLWATVDPPSATRWAATAKARMDRALSLRQRGNTFGYSYGSGVDANYFNYDGNHLGRYHQLSPSPETAAALADMAVAASCATLYGQPVSLGSPWWKHTFTAYNDAGTLPEAILAASRNPEYAQLVLLSRARLFTEASMAAPYHAYDGEIGIYYNMLLPDLSLPVRPLEGGAFFSPVENGPVLRHEGHLIAMPYRSWGESTCGAVFATPKAVESQICSVILTAVKPPASGKPAPSHFPDAYSVVEDHRPAPEARSILTGAGFIAAATMFRPALGGPALPGAVDLENLSPWRRTDLYYADSHGFAGTLSLEAISDNPCTQVNLWAHVSDDKKISGREIQLAGGTILLEEAYAGKIKNLGRTWGYSVGFYPLSLLEARVKDADGKGFAKGETFRANVSMTAKGSEPLTAAARAPVGGVLAVEIRLAGAPRALLLFNPAKTKATWPRETGFKSASQAVGNSAPRELPPSAALELPGLSLTVLRAP